MAGTAVLEGGEVVNIRGVTSLCIRVARRHDGCAQGLAAALVSGGTIRGALIAGEPASGKSSLLRDLARQLAGGARGRRFRTVVVDERGELSGGGGLPECDVLLHMPKGRGIQQAVRCLAPDVVIFDELGTADEAAAVESGLNAGVAAIASAHCWDVDSLLRRPQVAAALRSGAFEKVVMLSGRRAPGRIERIYETGDLLAESDRAAAVGDSGRLSGWLCGGGTQSPRQFP